ncbi:hypothetical protein YASMINEVIRUS_805 [Yasminevirus sp. GU-2018]|uniref:Acid ceramidase N-terminal domain-containing protein n=1 Tax=Yasminevirus sp. GU-2018 TaxID=2420051 RepID=A0A5K0UA22_9VIRU|nr:hypothetical protein YASMINEVIRUS_805 [Yasminevirus sp. GU-2018]
MSHLSPQTLQSKNYASLTEVPRFIINLDLPPDQRWTHVIKLYKHKFSKVMDTVDTLLGGITGTALKWVTWWYSENVFYIEELKAISETSGVELEKLILLQLCYEMFSCCTSIVINDKDRTVHYRTMDWEMPKLADLTIKADFVKNDTVLFSATTWAGYVGVMTGVKQNVCTVALNYRRLGDSIFTNFSNSINGAWPIGFLIRHLLETESSYSAIKKHLTNSRLISPCYITLSGNRKSRAVIINRSREDSDSVERIGENVGDYIVQTNIDNSKLSENVPNIVYSKQRVGLTKRCMKDYECVSDVRELLQRFNSFPIINETTIYTTVMECQGGVMHSYTK